MIAGERFTPKPGEKYAISEQSPVVSIGSSAPEYLALSEIAQSPPGTFPESWIPT